MSLCVTQGTFPGYFCRLAIISLVCSPVVCLEEDRNTALGFHAIFVMLFFFFKWSAINWFGPISVGFVLTKDY